ncbi:MAG: YdjY domain-containing protein [Phycisphaerales bacterium]
MTPRAEAAPAPVADPQSRSEPPKTITLAEGLRLNRAERWIELDGFVPIDVREQDRTGYTLIRYLECIAVTPISGKDHEALMVTQVKPSTIHAALLTLGLEPGAPGAIAWYGREPVARPARGAPVTITYRTADQPPPGEPITTFIVDADTGEHFDARSQWVFAGSLFENDRYVADADGLVVGLHTFGTELVALQQAMSPDSFIEEPRWIAHPEQTPGFGASVIIRIAADR